jgi:threonylcarbamoyladenosine tRNA methylthiotransferase MtaB
MATPLSVAFYTLGCKLNFSESSALGRQFESAGYREVTFEDGADIYVINTCSVTDFADKKCRNIVRRALRQSPHAYIIVVGCYAQLKPKEIAEIPGVDLVLGAAEKFRILEYVNQLVGTGVKGLVYAGEISAVNGFEKAYSFGERTRTFLKIQDGCDYKCSFCTIPLARGQSRSDTVEGVLERVREVAALGVKEVVLTGVNIGDFGIIDGKRVENGGRFIDLIKQLDEVEGIERFRISSIEPNLCTDEIIEFVAASQKFVPHFHMPLQSGNDKQLREMKRRYKRDLYAGRVEKIKTLMPEACIGVDVIVGFPGETKEDFLESYRFIQELEVDYLHVFTYSERENTLAAEMGGKVMMEERRRRNAMLNILSEKKRRALYDRHLGSDREVLLEKQNDAGNFEGYTDNYIRVELNAEDHKEGDLVKVRLEEIGTDMVVRARALVYH